MIKVISTFQNTDVVPANSHGPYAITGGSPVTLSAGVPNANSSYSWDLGDGTTATTPDVVHTYGDDGIFLAKLTVQVNQPGGATSRHFALIRVVNVPPTVDAGPNMTVNEGDVVAFQGSFTDPQWLETHTARWDWGDSQPPDNGVVTETHNPPLGKGTVDGNHAWGDSGVYTVSLSVQDKGGAIGRASATVTVLNVPPKVSAGRPMFAYPCCVLTLAGEFIDPGWLDSHAAFWNFGDGSETERAVVRETHDPPAGRGKAIASHVYHRCGDYAAVCTVIDDDSGKGSSSVTIRVVYIRNPHLEDGFHERRYGTVANHWEPYLAQLPSFNSAPQNASPQTAAGSIATSGALNIFSAEEYCVHDGQRSQRIQFQGRMRAGILQMVGANPGWDYQITVWYSLNEQAGGDSLLIPDSDEPSTAAPDTIGGTARLGVDPHGNADPMADSLVWSEGYIRRHWAQLSVRVTAVSQRITIYLEGQGEGSLGVDVCLDGTALIAVQPFCPVPVKICVDFSRLETGIRTSTRL